jgi:hypothetical protein
MRFTICVLFAATIACGLVPSSVGAQGRRPRRPAPTVEGTAIVNVSDREETLPILCYERARPEAGFITDRGPRGQPVPEPSSPHGSARD